MDTEEAELAPAVESILSEARAREGDRPKIQATAKNLPTAFAAADADGRVPILAEVKPTSPTTDGQRTDDPLMLAERMVAGGAAGLSVLTEQDHFGGSVETLRRIRTEVDVPVLRKDFIVREPQLDEVAADLVLLIARFLDREWADDLDGLVAAARERGMEPLVEVHTAAELERAVSAGAEVIGINNRDLAALEVDLGTFERVAPEAPADVTLIAESGITTPADVRRMRHAGADGLLIGSAIMDGDVQTNTRRFTMAETDENP